MAFRRLKARKKDENSTIDKLFIEYYVYFTV